MSDLNELLNTDPIREFEKTTGHSYKSNSKDEDMDMLGFHLFLNSMKNEAVERAGDTTFSMSGEDYAANIMDFGFELIYREDFEGTQEFSEPVIYEDSLQVYWHSDGLLLYFDTYNGTRNSGKVWYNWLPDPESEVGRCTSSGGYGQLESGDNWELDNLVWVGDHDCREAVRNNITRLRDNGTLLPVWEFQPSCMWITHWGEKDLFNSYENIGEVGKAPTQRTEERISKFPQHVQNAIKGKQGKR